MKELIKKHDEELIKIAEEIGFGTLEEAKHKLVKFSNKIRKETTECVCDKMMLVGDEDSFKTRLEIAKIKKDILKELL